MKSSVKIMLLGISLMLFGIFLRGIYIGYLYNLFIEIVWTALPIIGFLVFLYGFFINDRQEDLTEKIYSELLEQKEKAMKNSVCKKCGKEYKEVYTACPWCGYKEK